MQRLLGAAVLEEREQPPTPPPTLPEDERRGEEPPPIERLSWFPRDVLLSLTQSALELSLVTHHPELLEEVAGDDRRADAALPPAAGTRLAIGDDAIPPEDAPPDDRRLADAFSMTDPGWASSVVAMGWRLFKKKRKFPNRPAPPHPLAADARVIVFGDWASGIERARNVATEIRSVLGDQDSRGRECHVIHLGDTYYAGWKYEYHKRFLPHWPVHAREPHGSWSLNGNHDMYTGVTRTSIIC